MNKSDDTFLTLSHVRKTFIGTCALADVNFSLRRGEIHGLVGENGSGKSTLVSIVAGILQMDEGCMTKNGEPYVPKSLIDANDNKVSIIVQEKGTIDELSVTANLFLGKESYFSKGPRIDHKRMQHEATKVLAAHGISNIDVTKKIKELSIEDQKLVELAKALYIEPDVLIVDETTTALSQNGRDLLFAELMQLKKKGSSIIFITHDLNEVFDYCDRITVMKDGLIVETVHTSDIDENLLKEKMVGREIHHGFYRKDKTMTFNNEVALKVHSVGYTSRLQNISFELHTGEILGIGGLTDCGMHELGKLLFKLEKPTKGEIEYPLAKRQVRNHRDAIHEKIGYLPKNRDQESIMLYSNVIDNICLPSLKMLEKYSFIFPKKEYAFATEGASRLKVKMSSVQQLCLNLSGGNKQKVAVVKWLMNRTRIFIMDCPTRGIDISVKAAIYALLEDLKKQGCAILIISEELQELIGMCDRLIIMKNGQIKTTLERNEDLSEEKIIHYMV